MMPIGMEGTTKRSEQCGMLHLNKSQLRLAIGERPACTVNSVGMLLGICLHVMSTTTLSCGTTVAPDSSCHHLSLTPGAVCASEG